MFFSERAPTDVIMHILSFLEGKDLINVSQVSQKLRRLATDDNIIKKRCLIDYNIEIQEGDAIDKLIAIYLYDIAKRLQAANFNYQICKPYFDNARQILLTLKVDPKKEHWVDYLLGEIGYADYQDNEKDESFLTYLKKSAENGNANAHMTLAYYINQDLDFSNNECMTHLLSALHLGSADAKCCLPLFKRDLNKTEMQAFLIELIPNTYIVNEIIKRFFDEEGQRLHSPLLKDLLTNIYEADDGYRFSKQQGTIVGSLLMVLQDPPDSSPFLNELKEAYQETYPDDNTPMTPEKLLVFVLEKMAEKHNQEALQMLGDLYLKEFAVGHPYHLMLEINGNKSLIHELDVDKDNSKAKEYYEKGAALKDGYCEYRLGRLALNESNLPVAFKHFQNSVRYGSPHSCYELAKIHLFGNSDLNIEENPDRAREFITKACSLNVVPEKFYEAAREAGMAELYLEFKDNDDNVVQAIEWGLRSVLKGYSPAAMHLKSAVMQLGDFPLGKAWEQMYYERSGSPATVTRQAEKLIKRTCALTNNRLSVESFNLDSDTANEPGL